MKSKVEEICKLAEMVPLDAREQPNIQRILFLLATIDTLERALKSYLYNPHCATTVADGKHSAYGFCKTCADQYSAGQDALG